MKHPETRELFAYWNGLRGARAAPERNEIDPAAIRDVLADTFMLDVDIARGFPFRLAGTRVNGLYDADQKGRSFVGLWRPAERRNVTAVLQTVADGACPVVAGAASAPRGRPECSFEFLFLPLRHFGKTHARILALVKIAEKPDWYGLLPIGPFNLRSLRVVDDVAAALPPHDQSTLGREQADRTLLPVLATLPPPEDRAQRGRPKLTIIQGGL